MSVHVTLVAVSAQGNVSQAAKACLVKRARTLPITWSNVIDVVTYLSWSTPREPMGLAGELPLSGLVGQQLPRGSGTSGRLSCFGRARRPTWLPVARTLVRC
jgi:hypothetical protein